MNTAHGIDLAPLCGHERQLWREIEATVATGRQRSWATSSTRRATLLSSGQKPEPKAEITPHAAPSSPTEVQSEMPEEQEATRKWREWSDQLGKALAGNRKANV